MSDETVQPAPDTGSEAGSAEARLAQALSPDPQLAQAAGAITQLPAGVKLTTDLNRVEKERPGEPFWFALGEPVQYFQLLHPEDVVFEDVVIGQEDPRLMMHVLLGEEPRDRFFRLRPTVGQMKKLIADYLTHFGLTDLGELAGSAPSSNGSQGR